jgi:hypothetical protein
MITFLIIIAVIILVLVVKSRKATELNIKTAAIPAIFEKLKTTGKDRSFAVLGFMPPGKTSPQNDGVNVQFSIEGNQIGLDWVLIGPTNIRDKDKFIRFATELGCTVVEREMNKVKYLRVEEGDLPRLCEALIRDSYSVSPDTDLYFNPDGFAWP